MQAGRANGVSRASTRAPAQGEAREHEDGGLDEQADATLPGQQGRRLRAFLVANELLALVRLVHGGLVRHAGARQVDDASTLALEQVLAAGGSGAIGGEYTSQDGDHSSVISLNFSQIAFIEPGKTY